MLLLTRVVSQTLTPFLSHQSEDDLGVLRELIESGKVTPVIGRTYPLTEAAAALAHVGEGHARAKVVLSI
jgi:NADPH:quinone reductase-like Zn-dependent oxidoreductase